MTAASNVSELSGLWYIIAGLAIFVALKVGSDRSISSRDISIRCGERHAQPVKIKVDRQMVAKALQVARKKRDSTSITKGLPVAVADMERELSLSGFGDHIDHHIINLLPPGYHSFMGSIVYGGGADAIASQVIYEDAVCNGTYKMAKDARSLLDKNDVFTLSEISGKALSPIANSKSRSATFVVFRDSERRELERMVFGCTPCGSIMLYLLCRKRLVIRHV